MENPEKGTEKAILGTANQGKSRYDREEKKESVETFQSPDTGEDRPDNGGHPTWRWLQETETTGRCYCKEMRTEGSTTTTRVASAASDRDVVGELPVPDMSRFRCR